MAKIVRVLIYEGSEQALRYRLAKDKADGIHRLEDYTLTIATQFNDLPKLLTDSEIIEAVISQGDKVKERCLYCSAEDHKHYLGCPYGVLRDEG